jgi:Spy/CpxP family protein refolding chaperone
MKGTKRICSIVFAIAVGLFILGLGLPCFSQPPREGRPGGPGLESNEPPPPFEKRGEVRKRIELIRMWKLTEELNLTEETGTKLFPILHKYDEKRMELHKERRNTMNELRKALKDEATTDEAIEAAMDKWEKSAFAEFDLMRQQREELKGVLSPRQQAKFVLFQRKFHREIRKIISEARERRRRPRGDEGKAKHRRYDRPKED